MKDFELDRDSKPNILSRLYGKGKGTDAIIALLLALLTVFCYILITGLVSLSFKLVVKVANAGASEGKIETLTQKYSGISGIVGNIVALAATVLIVYLLGFKIARTLRLNKAPALSSIAPAFVLGFALNFFCDTAITLIPFPQSMIDRYEEIYSFIGSGDRVTEFMAVVLIAPVVEEIVFRGLALGSMRGKVPKAAAVIISAALFGAAHANVISFIFTFILGVVLALTFDYSDSLFIPIAIHVEFNASSYLVSYVLEKTASGTHLIICIVAAAISAISLFFAIRPYVKRKKAEAASSANKTGETSETENGDNI